MRTPLIKKVISAGLAAAVCLLVAVDASAIDRDKLIQMAKIGLGDDEIITLIDSSGPDELTFTVDEVEELRLQGVSDKVIDHIKKSGRVKGGQTAAAAPASSAPAPAGDVTPPPAPAIGDVGAPGEFAPAPADEEKKLLTQEDVDAEMKRRLQEQKEKEIRERKIKQAALKMPEANKLVASGDNMKAAKIYLSVLALDPEVGSPEWYEATYGFGKALFQEKIYSGASQPLFAIVKQGPDGRHFKDAFDMLDVISREINFQPPELEELSALNVSTLNKDFQSQFDYYMGRFFFDYNRSELAIQYFSKVPPKSPKYAEAMYMQGAAKLDESVNDITGALRDFEAAIRAAEKAGKKDSEILQLSYLALARTFYEAGFYDVALYYYQKLPPSSSRNADAQLEQAWTYFLKNDYKRALGVFHTLHSPLYSKWYYPDLYILEATVYLNLCMFERSKRALAEFDKDYISQKPKLDEFLAETTTPKAYWDAMMTTFDKSATEAKIPRIFANAVVDDLQFYNAYKVIQRLGSEQRTLKKNLGALGEYGQTVLKSVNQQIANKIAEGGILVQQKLTELSQQLGDWEIKATQISFDIDSEDKAQLEERLTNPDWKPAERQSSGSTFMVVADDWELWPFEGEYWVDEASSYRSGLKSQCVERK